MYEGPIDRPEKTPEPREFKSATEELQTNGLYLTSVHELDWKTCRRRDSLQEEEYAIQRYLAKRKTPISSPRDGKRMKSTSGNERPDMQPTHNQVTIANIANKWSGEGPHERAARAQAQALAAQQNAQPKKDKMAPQQQQQTDQPKEATGNNCVIQGQGMTEVRKNIEQSKADFNLLEMRVEKYRKDMQTFTMYTNNMAHTISRHLAGQYQVKIPIPKLVKGIKINPEDDNVVYDAMKNNYIRQIDRTILPLVDAELCSNVASKQYDNTEVSIDRAFVKVTVSEGMAQQLIRAQRVIAANKTQAQLANMNPESFQVTHNLITNAKSSSICNDFGTEQTMSSQIKAAKLKLQGRYVDLDLDHEVQIDRLDKTLHVSVRKGLQNGAKEREIILTDINYIPGAEQVPEVPGYQRPIERFNQPILQTQQLLTNHTQQQQPVSQITDDKIRPYMGKDHIVPDDRQLRNNIMTPLREQQNTSALKLAQESNQRQRSKEQEFSQGVRQHSNIMTKRNVPNNVSELQKLAVVKQQSNNGAPGYQTSTPVGDIKNGRTRNANDQSSAEVDTGNSFGLRVKRDNSKGRIGTLQTVTNQKNAPPALQQQERKLVKNKSNTVGAANSIKEQGKNYLKISEMHKFSTDQVQELAKTSTQIEQSEGRPSSMDKFSSKRHAQTKNNEFMLKQNDEQKSKTGDKLQKKGHARISHTQKEFKEKKKAEKALESQTRLKRNKARRPSIINAMNKIATKIERHGDKAKTVQKEMKNMSKSWSSSDKKILPRNESTTSCYEHHQAGEFARAAADKKKQNQPEVDFNAFRPSGNIDFTTLRYCSHGDFVRPKPNDRVMRKVGLEVLPDSPSRKNAPELSVKHRMQDSQDLTKSIKKIAANSESLNRSARKESKKQEIPVDPSNSSFNSKFLQSVATLQNQNAGPHDRRSDGERIRNTANTQMDQDQPQVKYEGGKAYWSRPDVYADEKLPEIQNLQKSNSSQKNPFGKQQRNSNLQPQDTMGSLSNSLTTVQAPQTKQFAIEYSPNQHRPAKNQQHSTRQIHEQSRGGQQNVLGEKLLSEQSSGREKRSNLGSQNSRPKNSILSTTNGDQDLIFYPASQTQSQFSNPQRKLIDSGQKGGEPHREVVIDVLSQHKLWSVDQIKNIQKNVNPTQHIDANQVLKDTYLEKGTISQQVMKHRTKMKNQQANVGASNFQRIENTAINNTSSRIQQNIAQNYTQDGEGTSGKHLSTVAKKEVELEKLRQYMMTGNGGGNQQIRNIVPGQKNSGTKQGSHYHMHLTEYLKNTDNRARQQSTEHQVNPLGKKRQTTAMMQQDNPVEFTDGKHNRVKGPSKSLVTRQASDHKGPMMQMASQHQPTVHLVPLERGNNQMGVMRNQATSYSEAQSQQNYKLSTTGKRFASEFTYFQHNANGEPSVSMKSSDINSTQAYAGQKKQKVGSNSNPVTLDGTAQETNGLATTNVSDAVQRLGPAQ